MKRKILLCALSFFAVALFSIGIAFLPNIYSELQQDEIVQEDDVAQAADGNIGIRVYHNVYFNGVISGSTALYTNGYELGYLGYVTFRAGITTSFDWVSINSYSNNSTTQNTATGGNSNTWGRSAKLQMTFNPVQTATSNATLQTSYYIKTSTSGYLSNTKSGGTTYSQADLRSSDGIDLGVAPSGRTVYITIIVSWLGQPKNFSVNFFQDGATQYTMTGQLNYGSIYPSLLRDTTFSTTSWTNGYRQLVVLILLIRSQLPNFQMEFVTRNQILSNYWGYGYSKTVVYLQNSSDTTFALRQNDYIEDSVTLYAAYPICTLNFDKNGGSGGTNSIQAMYRTFLQNTIEVPTRTGYTFAGYTYNGTQVYNSSGTAVVTNTYSGNSGFFWNFLSSSTTMTLVAQWNAIPSTLTIDPNGGSYSGSTSITNGYGSTYSISSPSRTGYSLGAWVLDGGGTISTFGKLHDSFTDPFFMDGTNSTYVYNNASNGTVTHQYIASSNVDIELPSGARILRITNTGSASPGLGGFTNHLGTRANAVFYTIIYAKIPVGYRINAGNNSFGDGGTKTWLTSQEGTGDWQVYIHRWNCGSSGSFSTVNYYYLSGTAGTTSNPVVWEVAYFGTYDATGLSVSGSSTTTLTYTYDDSNNSLVALWNINSYTLTVNPNGGTWSGSTSNQTFTQNYLTTKEIAEPTRTGYIFNGWSLSGYGSFSGTTFTYGAGSATLRANWIETWAVNYTIPSGSGTEEDPYQVDSASDLAYFAYKTQILGEQCYDHIVLTRDIDLAGYDWMPIGTGRNVVSGVQPYFRGTFDGQGHSISNLNINTIGKTTYAEYGLFGLVDVDAKLKNFTILSGQVNGLGERTGGVVGYVWSATIEKVTNYASVSGTIDIRIVVGYADVNGMVTENIYIDDCVNYASVSGVTLVGGCCWKCTSKLAL